MPGRLKVRLLAARDLPVMDRASDSTDAFVEVRFDGEMFKTEVCKKSLNPQWNSEWFKFEVDDEVLQDEPLDVRVLDYDTYSAHDAIGKVYIDLTPLLTNDSPYVISGWFPIYDTMHGIRGELHVQVKVELFTDVNKFRQTSCEIQFFCTAAVPSGYRLLGVQGFVEELVVNDDPEYQLIDKLRTSRASNEARQRLFSKLSGELQRKLGVKVLEMGGNAVLGYTQNFDLEGESGIVVRAIGTAVNISKAPLSQCSPGGTSPSALRDMLGTSLTNTNQHPHFHHLHHQNHHHHHNHPPRRRRNSQSEKHDRHDKNHHGRPHPHHSHPNSNSSQKQQQHHRSTTALASSPPLTPVKVSRNSGSGSSPPPSAPAFFGGSPAKGFAFGSEDSKLKRGSMGSQGFPGSQSAADPREAAEGVEKEGEEGDGDVSRSSSPFVDGEGGASDSSTPGGRVSASPVRLSSVTLGGSAIGKLPRLSDSELGSPTAGNLGDSTGGGRSHARHASAATVNLQNISLLEYPFFTMRSFPPGFIVSLGSVVAARSVKLLDKIHNPDEPETRDMWWSEIRTEIRSHARSMNCHAVLGYLEETTICEETIILSASGTAARITMELDQSYQGTSPQPTFLSGSPATSPASPQCAEASQGSDKEKEKEKRLTVDIGLANRLAQAKLASPINESEEPSEKCSLCHIPYHSKSLPFQVNLSSCAMCKKKKVPDVLFTTIDPPREIPILSHGALIQARVVRPKSKGKGSETSAREVSDSLPFLEYELHTQLLNKLKMRGLNAIFGLRIQICLGETMIAAVATGTGVFLGPMPQPPLPKLSTQVQVATQEETVDLERLQARITNAVQEHRQRLNMQMTNHLRGKRVSQDFSKRSTPRLLKEDSDSSAFGGGTADESDPEDQPEVETHTSKRDTFVLEIDDPKDEILSLVLRDFTPPEGFEMCNTQVPPGVTPLYLAKNSQMFTQMCQMRYVPHINNNLEFADVFDMLLRRICFKLRRLAPCYLTDLYFHVQIPDEDEVQIAVTGCCLTFGEPKPQPQSNGLLALPTGSARVHHRTVSNGEDFMFSMEVESDKEKDRVRGTSVRSRTQPSSAVTNGTSIKTRSDDRKKNIPKVSRGVELTPLPTVIGGKIVRYLGNYNFFLIRESTSVKETGGLGGFMQSFIGEVMAIVRGHVTATGGNALVGYKMTHCVLFSNLHKNQAQCLINVCGDAVNVDYGDAEAIVVPTEPNTAASDCS